MLTEYVADLGFHGICMSHRTMSSNYFSISSWGSFRSPQQLLCQLFSDPEAPRLLPPSWYPHHLLNIQRTMSPSLPSQSALPPARKMSSVVPSANSPVLLITPIPVSSCFPSFPFSTSLVLFPLAHIVMWSQSYNHLIFHPSVSSLVSLRNSFSFLLDFVYITLSSCFCPIAHINSWKWSTHYSIFHLNIWMKFSLLRSCLAI